MAEIDPIKLPFDEAIDYFASKTNLDTDSFKDTLEIDNDAVFTVATAKGEILQDLRDSVSKAQSEGLSAQDFLKSFDRIADRYSPNWLGKGSRAWRGQLIVEQNLRAAHAAGREQQMSEPSVMKLRPYWQVRHGDSRDPRPAHLALDGLVFPAGEAPLHYPAGFNCKCALFSLSRRDLVRRGLSVSTLKLGDEIDGVKIEHDPGFGRTKQERMRDTLDKFDPTIRVQVEREIGTAEFKLPEGTTRRRNGINYVLKNSRWHREEQTRLDRSSKIFELTAKFREDMDRGDKPDEEIASTFLAELTSLGDRSRAKAAAGKIDFRRVRNKEDIKTIMRDATDFYQLIDKDLDIKKIRTSNDRPSADKEKSMITVSSMLADKWRRGEQFHEMAHFAEFRDPDLIAKSQNWILGRATGPLTRLNKLTDLDYDDSEYAYPDNFVDPYVGKIYPGRATEVISTGLEAFSRGETLAELYRKDPDHFSLIMRFIRK